MARPQKEGLDYFPHDTDAMNDEKLEIMQLLYGNDGYAFYFKLLERIYRTPDLELDISDTETKLVLIKKCNVDEQRFDMMLNSAIKHDLFDATMMHHHSIISSSGIKKRAEMVLEKRKMMRQRYIKQGDGVSDAETSQETSPETSQRKEKERKEKERKEEKKHYGEFVSLLPSEYQHLVEKHGQAFVDECIKTLDNYKGQSGKYYKSDYRAILNWVIQRVTERMNKPAHTQTNAHKQPSVAKPQMNMVTQGTTPTKTEGIEDDWMEVARKLDEGSSDE
jgi:hypothetical protein